MVMGTFTYGTQGSFTLPADGTVQTVLFQDIDDNACQDSDTVGPLTPCSTECALTILQATAVCDDNGTSSDPLDDFYTVTVNADATNGGASGTFMVNGNGPFTYLTGGTFTLPADGSTVTLTFSDTDDATCMATQDIGPLTPCSSTCIMSIDELTFACDDNGTGTDATDDFYTITVNASATNGGTSNMYEVLVNGMVMGTFTYGTQGIFILPADGSIQTITFFDLDDITCQATDNLGQLNPCSEDCTNGETMVQTCDDNDPCTVNDEETILISDGSICIPCAGTPVDCNTVGETITQMCDDGDPNTVNDMETILTCNGSICVPCAGILEDCDNGSTSVQPCDDNNPCTINDEETILDSDGTVCVPCAGMTVDCNTVGETITQMCDDGDPNTVNDMETILTCNGSICMPCAGTPVDCDTGATSVQPCDDNNPCTTNDEETILDSDGTVCVPCAGTPVDCNTVGETTTQMCDDGDPNTSNDMETILTCNGSICVPCAGTPVDCDTGATSVQPCDDNNPCTINDEETILDSDGTVCVPCAGIPVDCDTGDTSIQPCDDGDPCTTNDVQIILDCDGSVCQPCMGEDIVLLTDFAEDDEYEVAIGESVIGNLLLNDDLDNINLPTIQLASNPVFGVITINQDGSFEYIAETDFSGTEEFEYIVCSTDCTEECASATVIINIIDTEIFIPDAISPNGDGINDTWIIPGLLDSKRRKMTVINRWGDYVYQSDLYNNDWDGTNSSNGKPLPEGTYYYHLRLDLVLGGLFKGTITIIR